MGLFKGLASPLGCPNKATLRILVEAKQWENRSSCVHLKNPFSITSTP
jgi:hypothetical protein